MKLNEVEIKIINLLKEYSQTLVPPVIPRIAGGWVRDKLLGKETSDMDVALDNITGMKFAIGLVNYIGINTHVGKIMANPEKSKHLETAVVHLFGLTIDFVHLRTESYTSSRIPQITHGTPQEDAYRRDITINALFYNLITNEIEDFTGKGLYDLRNKIINTPLNPNITLLDDPLRILRIFRFSVKFNFKIDNQIYNAIKHNNIRIAFSTKISCERIWHELFTMLNYKNGYLGLIKLSECNFIEPIFKHKNSTEKIMLFVNKVQKWLTPLEINNEQILLRLYIILHEFSGIYCGKNFLTCILIINALKPPKYFITNINIIESNLLYLKTINLDDFNILRIQIELIIECGKLWKESLIIFYGMGNTINIENIFFNIFNNHLEEKCFKKQFKINGNDIKNIISEKHVSKISNYLKKCKILEIENEHLSKKEILDIVFNNYI